MPSYSRNSRKPLQALTLAVTAALLTASAVHAAEESTKFVLTAYTNGAGGTSLLSGNYDAALAAIAKDSTTTHADSSAVETNKCVAYTMAGRLDTARSFCDAAIRSARQDLTASAIPVLWERAQLTGYLAVAYSNRAVLAWVSNDAASAARDLAAAVSISPDAAVVAHNISALRSPHESHQDAVAQLSVAPRS